MAAIRTQQEIEQDITNIDHALSTVSEIRSCLQQFVNTVKTTPTGPTYVHQFSEGLNKIKREINRITAESENLKTSLEYVQQISQANNFEWPAIKEAIESEPVLEQQYQVENKDKRETGNMIKKKVDYLFSELSSISLDKYQESTSNIPDNFITNHFNQWIETDKQNSNNIIGEFVQPEQLVKTGSACSLKISVHKVLTATLDLEYHHFSDSLIIHRYEIKGPKEQKPFWQESKYNVFRKINVVAAQAFEDISVLSAREALIGVLNWLSSYQHLFTEPCHRCKKRLQFDSPQFKHLPPVVRTWAQQKNNGIRSDEYPASQQYLGVAFHLRCFTGFF
ncbi:unnamed protein product [Cunninghamella blakesleeana]